MQIAKVDSNNKVVDTFVVKVEKVIDKTTGSPTASSVQNVGEKMFGTGFDYFYEGITLNTPNVGQFYHAETNSFRDERPVDIEGNVCTSWTYTSEHLEWRAPHFYGSDGNSYKKYSWRESNQKWYAQRSGVENDNWWTWDNTNQLWVDTGSSTI